MPYSLSSLYRGAPDEGNQFTTKEVQQQAHPHGSDSSHHIPFTQKQRLQQKGGSGLLKSQLCHQLRDNAVKVSLT